MNRVTTKASSKKRARAASAPAPGTGDPLDAAGLESALLSAGVHIVKLTEANRIAVARATKLEIEAQALREQVKSLQNAVPTGPSKRGAR